MMEANYPAPSKAGTASRLAIGHHWPGLPEPVRSACGLERGGSLASLRNIARALSQGPEHGDAA